jgi:CubicO group peptidase (beta-lactamase class C family)
VVLAALLLPGASRADAVDDFMRARLSAQHVPGAAVVVVRDGKAVKTGAYGYADLERRVPARAEDLFEIGSITKQFTATGVMMLVEAGKAGLDDAVSKYLPDLPEAWRAVTLRQLLTHTSGVPNLTEAPAFSWEKDYTPREGLDLVADKPLEFAPGAQWKYSNTGYVMLGLVIEAVGGKSYGDFMAERIFRPLGMTHTRMADARAVIPGRALGYQWDGAVMTIAPLLRKDVAGGAGAILSNVGDMAKWAAALDSGRLIKKSSQQEMWTPTRLTGGGTADYGFGWGVATRNGVRVVDHGGGTAGFSSMLRRYRDQHLTVVLLTNRAGADTGGLVTGVAGIIEPRLKPAAEKPDKDPDPAFTTRLKGILEKLLSDEPDLAPFTPEMAAALTPALLAQVRRDIGAFGALGPVVFLTQTETPAGPARRYRATYGATPVTVTVVVAKDGKIAGLWATP